ncbi:serine hydrolase domain-containing protein [Streptomyces sp. NBC_00239]|uniref:serine hydrolase domain-containing protein n=1 Tax=Streptomyces sp. NBC_00239 TaxID=2903640 RepID=UPI002E2B0BBB|nr:serine hydrolase domain-containing protein [Streptomyces sp. NBC_00239]
MVPLRTAASVLAPCALAACALAACALAGAANSPAHASADDRESRSAQVLRELVPSPDTPGCAAAVGVRGNVVWEAGRGKADLATGRTISPKTVFDMAYDSKQFTADAVLLLAGRGRLALDDPLSRYLDDPPAWARNVTLGELMHHTSGITDYQDLLEAKGIALTDPAGPFKVSPDRNTAVTVVCNTEPPDSFPAAGRLLDMWTK